MPTPLGKVLKKYRKQKNFSIADLSEKLGVSTGFISNLETGKSDSFHLDLLIKIIKELDIPLNEIVVLKDFITNNVKTSQDHITIDISAIGKSDRETISNNIEKLISTYLVVINTSNNPELIEKITESVISQLNLIESALKSGE